MVPFEDMPPPEDVLGEQHGRMTGQTMAPPSRDPQVAAPKKRKTGLVVLAVIGVLLLCCCGAGSALVGLGVWAAEEGPIEPPMPPAVSPPASVPATGTPGDHLESWNSFAPVLGAPASAASEWQMGVARAVTSRHLPEFSLVDVLVEPGGTDEEGDFIADYYYVSLRSAADPDVALGYEFMAATQEWVDADAAWDPSTVGEDESLDSLDDGTEYVTWTNLYPDLIDGSAGQEYYDLLSLVAADWPGSVNTWVDYFEDADGYSAWVYPTTWEQYTDSEPFVGFEAAYAMDSDGWYMASWEPFEVTPAAK